MYANVVSLDTENVSKVPYIMDGDFLNVNSSLFTVWFIGIRVVPGIKNVTISRTSLSKPLFEA